MRQVMVGVVVGVLELELHGELIEIRNVSDDHSFDLLELIHLDGVGVLDSIENESFSLLTCL